MACNEGQKVKILTDYIIQSGKISKDTIGTVVGTYNAFLRICIVDFPGHPDVLVPQDLIKPQ